MSDLIWSQYQEAIFKNVCTSKRHTVINSRAGGAKTTTCVEGTSRVPRGLSVAMCAFNKSIADTLKARVRNAAVATFHSVGLRTSSRALGRVEVDKQRVDKLCRAFDWGSDYTHRKAVEKAVSLAKNSLVAEREPLDELLDEFGLDVPPNVGRAAFVEQVVEVLGLCKEPNGTIDFDDMIWLPVVRDLRPDRYDVLFVDELQDMNPAQLELAFRMMAPNGRIIAAGDDRQAIYGFRGAQHDAVNWLAQKLDADILPLPICYRCDAAIIELAQTIVHDIEAPPDVAEGSVTDTGLNTMLRGAQAGDFVLSRSNAPLISTCLRLLSSGTRARIQGRDIGTNLASFVRNSRCGSVTELRGYIGQWRDAEVARLTEEKRSPQTVKDKAECLLLLSDGMPSPQAVISRIEGLFSDDGDAVVCSTIHKAKGLEADRVWLLGTSFTGCHRWVTKQLEDAQGGDDDDVFVRRARKRVREENNILYVGITRARHELFCVDGVPSPLDES